MWSEIVLRHGFLRRLTDTEQSDLKRLSGQFLLEKEYFGAHDLIITDHMALTVAAQACLPLLHMRPPSGRLRKDLLQVLDWYDDFVGIVIQPGAALARRQRADAAGVVHQFDEALSGEAMDRGPVMLSWDDVMAAPSTEDRGSNLVIHEFVHKIDMRGMHLGEAPDGAPSLMADFWDTGSVTNARRLWRSTMSEAFDAFRESLSRAERFGGEPPWLDAYAATHPAEFFSVACEAYFVNRDQFGQEFPSVLKLFDGFFRAVN